MKGRDVKFNIKEVFIIVIISTLFMSVLTGFLVYKKFNDGVTKTNNKYINEFIKAYNDVLNNYYENVDEEKIIDAAINGMFGYLGDDYTTYLDEENTNDLNEKLAGTYEGIGVTISKSDDGNVVIKSVLDGSPAKKSGLLVGDIIKEFNGKLVKDLSMNDLTDEMSNADKIKLLIARNNEEKSFELEKKQLLVPAITNDVKETKSGKKIGYMHLSSFTSSLSIQFKQQLAKFENQKIDNLILDLRGNSGGYLKSATDIIEMFLEKDKIMFSLQYKNKKVDYKDETDEAKKMNIVILINKGSASASEVLTSALKDYGKATVVGETSYGKGKVQMTGELEDGSMYKYTSATWLTPKGECIDKKGIVPDYEVLLDDTYLDNPIPENDNQLNKAIELFEN